MVDIQYSSAENRRGKKKEIERKKKETTAAKYNGLPYWAGITIEGQEQRREREEKRIRAIVCYYSGSRPIVALGIHRDGQRYVYHMILTSDLLILKLKLIKLHVISVIFIGLSNLFVLELADNGIRSIPVMISGSDMLVSFYMGVRCCPVKYNVASRPVSDSWLPCPYNNARRNAITKFAQRHSCHRRTARCNILLMGN